MKEYQLKKRDRIHSMIMKDQFRKVQRFAAQNWFLIIFARFDQNDVSRKTDDNYLSQTFRYVRQEQRTNGLLSEWDISLGDANVSAEINYSR